MYADTWQGWAHEEFVGRDCLAQELDPCPNHPIRRSLGLVHGRDFVICGSLPPRDRDGPGLVTLSYMGLAYEQKGFSEAMMLIK